MKSFLRDETWKKLILNNKKKKVNIAANLHILYFTQSGTVKVFKIQGSKLIIKIKLNDKHGTIFRVTLLI